MPGPGISPEARATPRFLTFVRERLHERPTPVYPTVPFSKRQATQAAKATESFRAERAARLQVTASRTVFAHQAALPLMQLVQVQSAQFQAGFSASAYRTRFTSFGGGRTI